MKIEKALKEDFTSINQLLHSANLPLVDISENTEHFFKAVADDGSVIGAIGLELYGNYGLLRSLVVNPVVRNQGIAGMLVEKIEALAKSLNLKGLYLLTTTAGKYFEKKSFLRINRNDSDEAIKHSKEFSSICPVSAVVMRRDIQLSELA